MTNGGNDDGGTGREPIPDERLSAWLDGALEQDEAAAMEHLAASDETLARRAARLRGIDDLVRSAVPLDDALPPELLDRLGFGPEGPASGEVVDFAAARARRDARTRPAGKAGAAQRRFGSGWRRVAGFALLVAAGLSSMTLLGIGGRSTTRTGAEYTALGDASRPDALGAGANAVVMFDASVSARKARAIGEGHGARLIAGPSSTGAWQFAIPAGRRAEVLSRLRARPDVTLAEPLDGNRR